MTWRSKKGRTAACLLVLIALTTVNGCASSSHHGLSDHQPVPDGTVRERGRDLYASYASHGKFSQATVLSSLFDSESLEMTYRELDSRSDPKRKHEAEGRGNVVAILGAERTELHSTSPQHGTALDERWHTQMGWSLLIDGQYDGAVAAYRTAIRHNRRSAEAHLGLGIALRMQQKIGAAIAAYQEALQLRPDYAAALVHLGYIYADGDLEYRNIEKAESLFHQASQQGDPFATIALFELKSR